MGSNSLYRKYRPRSLDDIVGQEHIAALLARAVKSGHVSHAYLMTGPHGVGKTSVARILAHNINNLPYTEESTHLDIIEIDAASNNGVEDVRDLRERVHVAPSSAKYKVYIIDEVHMLSKPAFNALLKTLEEPPEHVVFILATTDADKLPPTIISRVQRFNFRTIPETIIQSHLRKIADLENINIRDEALERIAIHGKGSFRDCLTLLDQLRNVSDGQIAVADVDQALGAPSSEVVESLTQASLAGDIASIAQAIDRLEAEGISARITTENLIHNLRQNLAENSAYLGLIDRLVEVPRSTYPYSKLLTALASFRPIDTKAKNTPQTLVAKAQPSATISPQPAKSTALPPQSTLQTGSSLNFDWEKLLVAIEDTAISSLLKKAGYSLSGSDLTIYVGNKWSASKLGGERLAKIHAALDSIGAGTMNIKLSPQAPPPSDSRLAAIADIMGGGKEVTIDAN